MRSSGRPRSASNTAFTRIELLVVFAVLFAIASLILPALARAKARPSRVKCVNNLKNVGLAYRIFSTDNSDRFPFELSTTNGGTRELTNNIVAQFQILSNELNTPFLIVCPNRVIKQTPARDFLTLRPSNISYYLSLSASESKTNSLLSGDAGFRFNNSRPPPNAFYLSHNDNLEYPNPFHTEINTSGAYTVLSDGSVQTFRLKNFHRSLPNNSTNLILTQ